MSARACPDHFFIFLVALACYCDLIIVVIHRTQPIPASVESAAQESEEFSAINNKLRCLRRYAVFGPLGSNILSFGFSIHRSVKGNKRGLLSTVLVLEPSRCSCAVVGLTSILRDSIWTPWVFGGHLKIVYDCVHIVDSPSNTKLVMISRVALRMRAETQLRLDAHLMVSYKITLTDFKMVTVA